MTWGGVRAHPRPLPAEDNLPLLFMGTNDWAGKVGAGHPTHLANGGMGEVGSGIVAGRRRASDAMGAAPAPAPAPAPPGERGAYDGGGLGLSVGDEVEIHGLKSAPEHNGKHAHGMKFVRKTGRYKVAVRGIVRSDSSGNYEQSTRWNGVTVKLAVRAVNLRPVAP